MLFWETSSAYCYLFRIGLDFLWVFFCLFVFGWWQDSRRDVACRGTLSSCPKCFFFYLTWSFFLLHPHMCTRTWHIISEKCLLFRMPWARLKKKKKKQKCKLLHESCREGGGAGGDIGMEQTPVCSACLGTTLWAAPGSPCPELRPAPSFSNGVGWLYFRLSVNTA